MGNNFCHGPNERSLDTVSLQEIRRLRAEHQFPPGSMGPKIDAAIHFIEGGGERAVIGHLDAALSALRGEAGTHIVRDDA